MISATQAQELLEHWWQPDGPVYSVVEDEANGVVYVGGAFNKVGPPMFGGTPLDRSTGLPVHTAPLPNDQAYDVVPDGQGGYYLGGAFTAVDGQPRNRIAHVSASGELLPFGGDAGAGFDRGTVERMLLHDGVLYVAHREDHITGSDPPDYWGSLHGDTGELLWNSVDFDGQVNGAFAAADGGWYVWGDFKYVDGQRRDGLARFSANGALHPWDARVNGKIEQVTVSGNVLYLTGFFDRVQWQDRPYIAAIDMATGQLLPFKAHFFSYYGIDDEPLPWLQVVAGKVYIGGPYEFINGVESDQAWLDAVTGITIPALFDANGSLRRVIEHNGSAYVCGDFTTVNEVPCAGFAKVDLVTGAVQPLPFTVSGGTVEDIRSEGDILYLTGPFTSVNGEPRTRVAQIDLLTGALTPWHPETDIAISRLEPLNGVVYISGNFASVGGQQRSGIAAVDPITAQVLPWQHQQPRRASVLGTNGVHLFGFVSGVSVTLQWGSYRLVALDATTGQATGWSMDISASGQMGIREMLAWNGELVLAGCIGYVGGVPRQGLARVDITSGQVSSWSTTVNGCVKGMELKGDDLYICGDFTQVGGVPRTGVAALSMTTAEVRPFSAVFSGFQGAPPRVNDIAIQGDSVYLVGSFHEVNGQVRRNLAALDLASFSLLDWQPQDFTNLLVDQDPTPGIEAPSALGLCVSGDTVFVVGRIALLSLSNGFWSGMGVSAIHRVNGSAVGELTGPRGRSGSVAVVGNSVFVMAEPGFHEREVIWEGGGEHANLLVLDVGTGRPHATQIDVVGAVHAIFLDAGYLYLAGAMSEVQGQAVSGVARIDAATGALEPFAVPVPWSAEWNAFVVKGPRLYMGSTNGVLVHDAITGEALEWEHQPNGRVRALAIHDDVLYMGGDFTFINAQQRMRLAAVDLQSGELLPWGPTCNGPVHAISASSTGVAFVGGFSMVQERWSNGLAMVTIQDGDLMPITRVWSDAGLPSPRTVAAEGEEVIFGTGSLPPAPAQELFADVLGYHPISGGHRLPYLYQVSGGDMSWWGVNPWDPSGPGALYKIHLSKERAYFAGQFKQLRATDHSTRYRHNLAVYSRPQPKGVRVSPRVRLGGASTSSGNMSDSLRVLGLLPAVEPYSALGYGHSLHGGAESADPPVFDVPDNNAIVDWVVVELRAATNPAQVLGTRSALLRRDGLVKDVDGSTDLVFDLPRGNYHIAIRHRNHLGVMTAQAIPLSADPSTVDFTDPLTPTYGAEAQTEVGGQRMLWPGDANFDGVVKYTGADNDRDAVLQAIGGANPVNVVQGTYATEDVNLDGTIKYVGADNDRDVILQTIGGTVPTAVRVEQVP
ncbi:MAG: PQQ-binding-like beta-propeller repeat protein [Flavobacteriales bacterium]|nr:PQQ-binding-like beta-propeller repeat protein [Flavobacteriales bacterium]